MNEKIWNALTFAAAVMVCYLFWILFLGGCYIDGFLDLDVVETADTWVKCEFVVLCLSPPIMMGYFLVDIMDVNKKRREKNGDQNES